MHRSFLTYVATVVQVQVDDAGKVRVNRVDTALDAGTIVNPEMIRQQVEGAAVMGISLSFYGEITATNGVIDQSNFDGFQMARMNNAPRETNTYIVPSDAPPAGIGEPLFRRLLLRSATRFLPPQENASANYRFPRQVWPSLAPGLKGRHAVCGRYSHLKMT